MAERFYAVAPVRTPPWLYAKKPEGIGVEASLKHDPSQPFIEIEPPIFDDLEGAPSTSRFTPRRLEVFVNNLTWWSGVRDVYVRGSPESGIDVQNETTKFLLKQIALRYEGDAVWWTDLDTGPIEVATLYDLIAWFQQPRFFIPSGTEKKHRLSTRHPAAGMPSAWLLTLAQWDNAEYPPTSQGGPPYIPGVSAAREATEAGTEKIYWEDLSREEKDQHIAERRRELEAIGKLSFPIEAVFGGEQVTVLGPVYLFPMYDDPAYGKPTLSSNAQLMMQRADGERFITIATNVFVDGKPLLGRNPPRRDPRDPWEKQLGILPRHLFHGTRNANVSKLVPSKGGEFGPGIYLTADPNMARFFAQNARGPDEPTVLEVNADIRNPIRILKVDWIKKTEHRTPSAVQRALIKKGHDAIIGIGLTDSEQIVVFDPAAVSIVKTDIVKPMAKANPLPPESFKREGDEMVRSFGPPPSKETVEKAFLERIREQIPPALSPKLTRAKLHDLIENVFPDGLYYYEGSDDDKKVTALPPRNGHWIGDHWFTPSIYEDRVQRWQGWENVFQQEHEGRMKKGLTTAARTKLHQPKPTPDAGDIIHYTSAELEALVLKGKTEAKEAAARENPAGRTEAKRVGDQLGVDWKKVSLDQFTIGIKVEREHEDVTHGDPLLTGKIALAHLKEDRDYYTKLKGAGLEADEATPRENPTHGRAKKLDDLVVGDKITIDDEPWKVVKFEKSLGYNSGRSIIFIDEDGMSATLGERGDKLISQLTFTDFVSITPPAKKRARENPTDDDYDHEAEELELFAQNTGELYPAKKEILSRIRKLQIAGHFDPTASWKMWLPWLQEAAKLYGKEWPQHEGFTKAQIELAAKSVAEYEGIRLARGEHDSEVWSEMGKQKPVGGMVNEAGRASARIKKGNPVEFTRKYQRHYAMGDGEFGIAVEDERPDGSVTVELADGSKYLARHIHAYAWGGWLPEELEPAYAKYNDFDGGANEASPPLNEASYKSTKLSRAINEFPETFGLRAWPGDTFRISLDESYINDLGDVTIYLERMQKDGGWKDFAKGSPEELKRDLVENRSGGMANEASVGEADLEWPYEGGVKAEIDLNGQKMEVYAVRLGRRLDFQLPLDSGPIVFIAPDGEMHVRPEGQWRHVLGKIPIGIVRRIRKQFESRPEDKPLKSEANEASGRKSIAYINIPGDPDHGHWVEIEKRTRGGYVVAVPESGGSITPGDRRRTVRTSQLSKQSPHGHREPRLDWEDRLELKANDHHAADFDTVTDALAHAYADGYRFVVELKTTWTVYKPIEDDGGYMRMTLYSEKGRFHWPYGGHNVQRVKSLPGKAERLAAKENPIEEAPAASTFDWASLPTWPLKEDQKSWRKLPSDVKWAIQRAQLQAGGLAEVKVVKGNVAPTWSGQQSDDTALVTVGREWLRAKAESRGGVPPKAPPKEIARPKKKNILPRGWDSWPTPPRERGMRAIWDQVIPHLHQIDAMLPYDAPEVPYEAPLRISEILYDRPEQTHIRYEDVEAAFSSLYTDKHGNLALESSITKENPIEDASVVADAIPWIKVTRDPAKFQEAMARAKELGPVDSPRKVYDLLSPALLKEDQEVFLVVVLDVHTMCRGVAEVHRGTRSSVSVSPTDVMRVVLQSGAELFVLCHNHPSGSAKPSKSDEDLTKAIQEAAAPFAPNSNYGDHVVIGNGEFYSFAENKLTKAK